MIKFNKKFDKIAFIAPASACSNKSGKMDLKKSQTRLQETIKFYENKGFICVYDDDIFTKDTLEYFAAPRKDRLDQLKNAIMSPEIKIIAAFRGGYGSTEIIFDCLDLVPSEPKILIGFSDITALHFLFNQKYNMQSIHGAMGPEYPHMIEEVINVLNGKTIDFNLQPVNKLAEKIKTVEGKMHGGNLDIITNLIGTKLNPKFDQKILFLEDVNEKSYQIHRSLLHLKNANLFDNVKAVIMGDFTNSDDLLDITIKEFTKEYLDNIPVYRTYGIGHGMINIPIVIGGDGVILEEKLKITSPFQLV